MFLMLLHWTTNYTEIMKAMFRWVVLVELVQNSWSFAVIAPSSSSSKSSSLLHQARSLTSKAIPWRKPPDDDRSIVSLEDIFLDELEQDTFGPGGDDADFLHQYDEVMILDALDVLDDDIAGEVVDSRELEDMGDAGLRP
jgi:hypothetical protein